MPSPINVLPVVNAVAVPMPDSNFYTVATVENVNVHPPQSLVAIEATFNCSPPTGTTEIVYKIVRGTDPNSGSVDQNNRDLTVVPGNFYNCSILCDDSPGEVDGESYSLVVSFAGATAAGNVNNASIRAIVAGGS